MSTLSQARAELAAEVEQKEADLAKAKSRLVKLDELINNDDDVPAPVLRKKPGPKPKVKVPDEEPKVRKKPGPKPKIKTDTEEPKVKGKPGPKPKAEKSEGASRAAEGRRAVARGERPPLKKAMAEVMGTDVCNPEIVANRLAAKGWTPDAKDPKTYVGYMLSSSKDDFERVPAKGRGFYRVKAKDVSEPVVTPVKAEPKTESNGASKRSKSTDEVLAEAGIDLSGPFGG